MLAALYILFIHISWRRKIRYKWIVRRKFHRKTSHFYTTNTCRIFPIRFFTLTSFTQSLSHTHTLRNMLAYFTHTHRSASFYCLEFSRIHYSAKAYPDVRTQNATEVCVPKSIHFLNVSAIGTISKKKKNVFRAFFVWRRFICYVQVYIPMSIFAQSNYFPQCLKLAQFFFPRFLLSTCGTTNRDIDKIIENS